MPPETHKECPECSGTGEAEHDCPCCDCECDFCDGAGKISSDIGFTVGIGGAPFAARYVRRLLALPGLEVAAKGLERTSAFGSARMVSFRFHSGEGELGEGLLMALIGKVKKHIRAKFVQKIEPPK